VVARADRDVHVGLRLKALDVRRLGQAREHVDVPPQQGDDLRLLVHNDGQDDLVNVRPPGAPLDALRQRAAAHQERQEDDKCQYPTQNYQPPIHIKGMDHAVSIQL